METHGNRTAEGANFQNGGITGKATFGELMLGKFHELLK